MIAGIIRHRNVVSKMGRRSEKLSLKSVQSFILSSVMFHNIFKACFCHYDASKMFFFLKKKTAEWA